MKRPILHKTLTLPRTRSGLRLPAALLASLIMLGGCASLPPADLITSEELRLERTDSRYAHIGRVNVRTVDSTLRVTGEVTQRYGRRGPIPGYLHIEAIGDRGGVLLATTKTSYHRLSIKAHKAQFSVTLPVDVHEVRTIRIIHHGLTNGS